MYQPTRHLIASLTTSMAATRRSVRLRRLAATSAFAALSLAVYKPAPAQAQVDQLCYAIADNNPASQGSGGGDDFQDTLASVDLDALTAQAVGNIVRVGEDGDFEDVGDIEALTSRPNFDALIAANANELGRIDPENVVLNGDEPSVIFESLGFIDGFLDFDAIVIDRNGNQTRLLAVSKAVRNSGRQNVLVEVILDLDGNQVTTGITSQRELATLSNFPQGETARLDTETIDGIAISPGGNILAIANGGPNTNQKLVEINPNTGVLTDRGSFLTNEGDTIPDVEDLSFDLRGDLFATTGSSRNPGTTERGYIYDDPGNGPLDVARPGFINLAATGAVDFEASACLRAPGAIVVDGEPLLVKRITAITTNGEGGPQTTRFDRFVNQAGTQVDNEMRTATGNAFPRGIVEAPDSLLPGDEVEYTVYLYNPEEVTFENVILCDPIRRPSVLQRDSIQFSDPNSDLTLDFDDTENFDRAPLAPADNACAGSLDGDNFLAGPPGPTGANGTGGGVVTDAFDIGPNQISATRFTIEVGALGEDDVLDGIEIEPSN